jgi:hypothetical protein
MKHRGRPIGASNGVIFSQERGKAWASWPGEPYYVQLGQQDEVAEMMKDYLAQLELGERLAKARERLEDAESSRYAR